MNHLQNQVSPYLLQHKNNPVDWFPWGEIALEKAKIEDKPIILSIGYAACHWCHVMEHESFENQEVADLMNAHFICIKVDREERTDIDLIYMDAIHAMGLQGGWPLHVFLMPDQKPFYGGTYFPKANWIQLLHSIQRAYQDNKIELQQSANNFANNLNDTTIGLYPMNLDVMSPIIPSTIEVILKGLDPIYGGTNKAPKFPIPSLALFLESLPKKLYKMSSIQKQADLQLTKMALGGIFDQVGGGFSRYSVDSEWFCPHFEKMLYDNAQLIRVYALAYQRTQNPLYREILSKTIEFVTSELQDTNGLYWTALDADSDGVEGLFYVWTYQELNELLPYISHQAFYQSFSISSKGNWEHNYNILFKKDSFLNLQFEFELNVLKSARSKRSRPATDTKQLLAWNALLAVGLIDSAKSLSDKNLLIDALSLVDTILNQFTDKNMNFVNHQIMFANKPISAFLDDLAALGLACMMAYQSQGNVMYLIRGKQLYHFIETNHFKQNNLYSYLSNQNDKLIAPKFEIVDSVCPSANSMVCEFYLWLGFLSDEPKLTIIGKNMMASILEQAQANPIYFANWLRIYSEWIENPKAIVKYNPNQINMEDLSCLDELCIPVIDLKNKFMVCIGDRCLLPCDDILILKEQLKSI